MKTDYLPKAEYKKIFAKMSKENALPLEIALETGLRIDDVLRLKRSQINTKTRTITYTAQKTKKKGTAEISEELCKKIKALPKQGFIFPSKNSKSGHRTRQTVYLALKKASKEMGIAVNLAPHSTRKTFAVEELKTKTLAEVQRELQHTNPLVTMVYAYSDKNNDYYKKTDKICPSELTFAVKSAIIELLFEALEPLKKKYLTEEKPPF